VELFGSYEIFQKVATTMKTYSLQSRQRPVWPVLVFVLIVFVFPTLAHAQAMKAAQEKSVTGMSQEQKEAERYKYAKSLIDTFTTGKIVELTAIPKTEIFARFLKDESKHEGITEAELRQKDVGPRDHEIPNPAFT
jgi:ATP-dependent Lon protease